MFKFSKSFTMLGPSIVTDLLSYTWVLITDAEAELSNFIRCINIFLLWHLHMTESSSSPAHLQSLFPMMHRFSTALWLMICFYKNRRKNVGCKKELDATLWTTIIELRQMLNHFLSVCWTSFCFLQKMKPQWLLSNTRGKENSVFDVSQSTTHRWSVSHSSLMLRFNGPHVIRKIAYDSLSVSLY